MADRAEATSPRDKEDEGDKKQDGLIRIARVGGRFLVFDVADVARLRRQHNLCAVLFGITPQAPNQGSFGGLPLELAPDEVRWLVQDRRAAYIADDAADHLAALASARARRRYRQDNWSQHQEAVQAAADAEAASRLQRSMEARARKMAKASPAQQQKQAVQTLKTLKTHRVRVTPTTSVGLVGCDDDDCALAGLRTENEPRTESPARLGDGDDAASAAAASASGLRAHLADRGYFATPGLRFGGDLSVYPGDPFRYHAHFVATSYGWDEPIVLLDLVGTGRLATGVKKGLLIGGCPPPGGETPSRPDVEDGECKNNGGVRTFTLEWAAL